LTQNDGRKFENFIKFHNALATFKKYFLDLNQYKNGASGLSLTKRLFPQCCGKGIQVLTA
jgi:hypothetical protein